MKTVRQIAKVLNEHCMAGNGFYLSTGLRAFGARTVKGKLEIRTGFRFASGPVWTTIDPATVKFRDSVGRDIL